MDLPASLSLYYIPTAVILGALHALEPGHAKTLTAAYLIGVRGTRRDAVLLGLSVAITHSFVVVLISAIALWLGREAFTDQATHWLQLISGWVVILLGVWLIYRRWPRAKRRDDQHAHPHVHSDHLPPHDHHDDHDHDHMSDDEHARAHRADLPDYVSRGERPTAVQIIAFGAAGGLIPCPASITVMLLALSIGAAGLGFLTVVAFSAGLAVTLVGVGLAVVTGLTHLARYERFSWFTRQAPLISAGMVLLSGCIALTMAH
jgi:nickel/cobalt transporter (NicO) family protein